MSLAGFVRVDSLLGYSGLVVNILLSLLEPQDGDYGQVSETSPISLGLPITGIICKRDEVSSRGWLDGWGLSRSLARLSLGWAG